MVALHFQVILNWLIAQENVVAIPEAKNGEQSEELSNEHVKELHSLASELRPVSGFPVECRVLVNASSQASVAFNLSLWPLWVAAIESVLNTIKPRTIFLALLSFSLFLSDMSFGFGLNQF
ncbi:hypothetical protein Ancab_012809 [Ancistrocladus abbreviatus]